MLSLIKHTGLMLLGFSILVGVACGDEPEWLRWEVDIQSTTELMDKAIVEATAQANVELSLTSIPSPATSIPPTPTLTPGKIEEAATCTLTGGEVVQKGWSGKDTGSNHCNQCRCMGPGLACTKMACHSIKPTAVPSPVHEIVKKSDKERFPIDYTGFTHTPVDFNHLFSEEARCSNHYLAIQPYFNYYITSHAEGAMKWYLATCSDKPTKIYLPVTVLLHKEVNGRRGSIRIFRDTVTGGSEGTLATYDGHNVLMDVQLYAQASEDITVFFMHLTLLEEIKEMVDESDTDYLILEAGTHIGYIYSNPSYGRKFNIVDMGVEDRSLLSSPDGYGDWWERRGNPFDYFDEETRKSILDAYKPYYERLVVEGDHPFTDLTKSQSSIDEDGLVWGTWFNNDTLDAFESSAFGAAWSVIHLTKTVDLSRDTFWKTLESNPGLSGLLVESNRLGPVGTSLYPGKPYGRSMFFLLSGNENVGVAKIIPFGAELPHLYFKFKVFYKPGSDHMEYLLLEAFDSKASAEISVFTDKSVEFRRHPCANAYCPK